MGNVKMIIQIGWRLPGSSSYFNCYILKGQIYMNKLKPSVSLSYKIRILRHNVDLILYSTF